ncbi:MAG: helix-turn-helix transcriptional regulator [Rhizobiales bacterium]|nr:helix-turn-helix transcriptional regulator [Hyphomicrobiales bacterium]
MAKLSTRAARIKAAAVAAYGPRGVSQLAAAAGVSKQMLSFIVTGAKPASDDVYRKVADALFAESERLITASEKIGLMAGKMIAELEK